MFSDKTHAYIPQVGVLILVSLELRNYISHIFIAKKIKHSMRNDILKVIKKQTWCVLENFGFEKKIGDRKIQNSKTPNFVF